MPRKVQTLESWISEVLTNSDTLDAGGDARPCSAFTTVLLKGNGFSTEEVLGGGIVLQGKTHDPAFLAKKFTLAIENKASQLDGGIGKFTVQAFYGQREPESSFHVRCVDGEVVFGDHGHAEEPTEKGILALMMRHTEQKDRMLMQVLEGTFGQWAKERSVLQSEVNDAYAIVRELMMKQADNSHAYAMQQLQFARSTGERQALMKMVPALANGLTGKDIFPKADQDSAIIDEIARNVRPEQLEMLLQAGIIRKEIYPALVARFAETHERDAAERRELANVPPTAPSSELNS